MPRAAELIRLGRPIDWDHRTNRAILLLTAALLVITAAVRTALTGDVVRAGLEAVALALSTFLAWAVAREVDPDADAAAFVAAALGAAAAAPGLSAAPFPDVAAVFWLLLVLRITNRSVGRAAGWPDTLAVFALTVYGVYDGFPQVGVLAAAAFAVDGYAAHPVPRHRAVAWAALLCGGAGFVAAGGAVRQVGADAADELLLPALLFAVTAIAALRWSLGAPPRARGDTDGRPLDPRRLQAARSVAVLALWTFAWQGGAGGVAALAPGWAALAGTALWPRSRGAPAGCQ